MSSRPCNEYSFIVSFKTCWWSAAECQGFGHSIWCRSFTNCRTDDWSTAVSGESSALRSLFPSFGTQRGQNIVHMFFVSFCEYKLDSWWCWWISILWVPECIVDPTFRTTLHGQTAEGCKDLGGLNKFVDMSLSEKYCVCVFILHILPLVCVVFVLFDELQPLPWRGWVTEMGKQTWVDFWTQEMPYLCRVIHVMMMLYIWSHGLICAENVIKVTAPGTVNESLILSWPRSRLRCVIGKYTQRTNEQLVFFLKMGPAVWIKCSQLKCNYQLVIRWFLDLRFSPMIRLLFSPLPYMKCAKLTVVIRCTS